MIDFLKGFAWAALSMAVGVAVGLLVYWAVKP